MSKIYMVPLPQLLSNSRVSVSRSVVKVAAHLQIISVLQNQCPIAEIYGMDKENHRTFLFWADWNDIWYAIVYEVFKDEFES